MVTDGIDVSYYQGDIDWEEAKKHIDFAILRVGYGQDMTSQDDKLYKRNADECTRLGIPFGVYIYSYATTEQEAIGEARHTIRLIKDYKLAYPVYYDLEDPKVGRLSNEQIEKVSKAFADEMVKNNYYVGFYASLYWWKTKLTGIFFERYTKWIAQYNDTLNYTGNYGMWQYTDKGFVAGVNEPVDMNYCYVDFPAEIKGLGMNGFGQNEGSNTPVTGKAYNVGDHVTFDHVYISSDSSIPLIPYMNHGTITRIEPDARNPYLIGNGLGWVNDKSITGTMRFLSNPTYRGTSLVDALAQIGVNTSFANRKKLAEKNGIYDYEGSASQNYELLKLLKEGRLKD